MNKWTRHQATLLLSLYEECECLYNASHPDYTNRSKRNENYHFIVENLKKVRPNVTVREVKDKIKTMQSQFSRAKAGMSNSANNGAEIDEMQKPSLWFYDQIKYLWKHVNGVPRTNSHTIKRPIHTNDHIKNKNGLEKKAVEILISPKIFAEEFQQLKHPKHTDGHIKNNNGLEKKAVETLNSAKIFAEEFQQLKHPKHTDGHIKKKNRLEKKAVEALNSAKIFAEEYQQLKQEQGREDEFCRFLCSELRKVKLEENFDELKYSILDLVRKTIQKEKQQISLKSCYCHTTSTN